MLALGIARLSLFVGEAFEELIIVVAIFIAGWVTFSFCNLYSKLRIDDIGFYFFVMCRILCKLCEALPCDEAI